MATGTFIGIALIIAGAAFFVRYSLARYLRFWLHPPDVREPRQHRPHRRRDRGRRQASPAERGTTDRGHRPRRSPARSRRICGRRRAVDRLRTDSQAPRRPTGPPDHADTTPTDSPWNVEQKRELDAGRSNRVPRLVRARPVAGDPRPCSALARQPVLDTTPLFTVVFAVLLGVVGATIKLFYAYRAKMAELDAASPWAQRKAGERMSDATDNVLLVRDRGPAPAMAGRPRHRQARRCGSCPLVVLVRHRLGRRRRDLGRLRPGHRRRELPARRLAAARSPAASRSPPWPAPRCSATSSASASSSWP